MFSAFLNEQSCYLHSTQKKNRQNLTPKNREREKMGSGEDGGMDRWRDGQKDGGMDRWTEGWGNGQMERRMEEWTDGEMDRRMGEWTE